MKTLILTLFAAFLITGCGKPPSEAVKSAIAGSATPPKVEYSLKSFYEVPFEGSMVQLVNLNTMHLSQTENITYAVDGIQCQANAILGKLGAVNLYHMQVWNRSPIDPFVPGSAVACETGVQAIGFWISLTSQYTLEMERSL
ncbi:MAG: hypothetical protein HC838_00170 [Spirulinaceae cyanobacterium RM2_2_10]|nr:hypothetical protein [Spirulinaceae cyanobacterium RM2_2_10]